MAANTKLAGLLCLLRLEQGRSAHFYGLCRSKQQQPTSNSVFLGFGMQERIVKPLMC